jgi:hypothetical protein
LKHSARSNSGQGAVAILDINYRNDPPAPPTPFRPEIENEGDGRLAASAFAD